MDNRTLREIYDYDMISDENTDSSLDAWYNVVMGKTVSQLTLTDIERMLRQKIFSAVAIARAIEMLEEDPFIGDLYEGQLFVHICSAKEKYLRAHYAKLEELIPGFVQLALSHEWDTEKEKTDFIAAANNFLKKVKAENKA